MSGHSHWASIKHKKGITDLQKGKVFSKLARKIEVAAKEGKDSEANPKLRVAIEKAKAARLSSENIERAIKRGAGEVSSEKLEDVLYEAYGPGGIVVIIEGITDNKNRTLNEIKQILSQNNGKLVGEGSVKWLFGRKGVITVSDEEAIKDKEGLELKVIESGAEDIYWHNNFLDIYAKPEELESVKKNLEAKRIKIKSSSLDWVAKEMIELDEKTKEACQKLFEALDENDAVQEIYSNLKN